jgi:S-adenosylmethionine hydrolase
MPPVIALSSDFAIRDHYAATLQGVILWIAP